MSTLDLAPKIAKDLELTEARVRAAVELLSAGNTVPFIARYRKEATGGLDEVQIRDVETRLAYRGELESRRAAVLKSIEEQGKLTPALGAAISGADTKTLLEDLYLPYKKKRRTRATVARERGLEPLAALIEKQAKGERAAAARAYVSEANGVPDVEAALAGARDIVAERLAESSALRADLRDRFRKEGVLISKAARGKKDATSKFEQYYDFAEPLAKAPSHRVLAVRRGEKDGFLRVSLEMDRARAWPRMAMEAKIDRASPFARDLETAAEDALDRLVLPSLENELMSEIKERADEEAVRVFAENLRHVLLQPLLGGQRVVGIDPGLRTGSKCAAVDATGAFQGHVTLYLTQGEGAASKAAKDLLAFVRTHRPAAIGVGNGTGGRETEAFVKKALSALGGDAPFVISVSEAGASVYSASDIARDEHPDLDLTIRGAISIARRLQDPLSELVKVEPKAIGVGQYQHDVQQTLLTKKLDEVVESCVNQGGVELNTASAPLLSYVAGIGKKLAETIVTHRTENGPFKARKEILKVSGLGPKAFEQCAGFLRIRGGKVPLDASAVHPERYDLVAKMAKDLRVSLPDLVGNGELARKISLSSYVGPDIGEPTLRDIVSELEKPGRDPRSALEAPSFRDDVHTMEDLEIGMELTGVVTNVTAFGAFVDIGVHQDGLVHVSQLSDRFVKDPAEVVHTGQTLKVRVLDVDLPRKRISLTAKKGGQPAPKPDEGGFSNHAFRGLDKSRRS